MYFFLPTVLSLVSDQEELNEMAFHRFFLILLSLTFIVILFPDQEISWQSTYVT